MRFIKDFICEKFYCSTDLFLVKVQTKEFVITEDDKGNIKGLFLWNFIITKICSMRTT